VETGEERKTAGDPFHRFPPHLEIALKKRTARFPHFHSDGGGWRTNKKG
jgi:hypothetical protein